MARLALILGDQLNPDHEALERLDRSSDRVLMGELWVEAHYVPHHVKKIVLIFSAMRHRAAQLEAEGWSVSYHRYDANGSIKSFTDLLDAELAKHPFDALLVAQPGEWRVLEEIRAWSASTGVALEIVADRRFIDDLDYFKAWAKGKKQLRMEFFYRLMRHRTGFLMNGEKPIGDVWNLDADNRKRWEGEPAAPAVASFLPDPITADVIELVSQSIPSFGELDGFDYPVTLEDAEIALDDFIKNRLPFFGDFQDAMSEGEDYLFHSRISSAMNLGLLDPMDVCRRAIYAWESDKAPLNAVEGFIRQIIGWREFIRGIYWHFMPEYVNQNTLGHDQPLPEWYWSGKTKMQCLAKAIDQTRRLAYAHHIQRLMVTGNFALLLGVIPEEICRWYLSVYIDAYEWVELPNTLGMVMHADGGLVGSKPYAASGKYIDRMGDHCKKCHYRVKETTEEQACPFNALYWDFLMRHQEKFKSNPRMKMMYRNVDRLDEDRREAIKERAQWLKDNVNVL